MPRLLRLPLLLLTLTACLGLSSSIAGADIPPIMSYSGELQGPEGTPLADGTYRLTFSLYASPTDGTPIWTEVHRGIEVTNGSFHAVLGRTGPAALIGIPFDRPYFLGVSVNSDPEMTPRQPLVALPYAFRSRLADQVADGAITTDKIGPLAVTDEKIKSVSWDKITGAPRLVGQPSPEPAGGSPNGQLSASPNGGPDGVPANVWSLQGNRNSNPPTDFLGTTDAQPLFIKVNNETLMELAVGGPISVRTGFEIDGDLEVGGNTRLHGTLDVDGATNLHSTLGVTGATSLLSTLDVTGATSLLSTLDVTGATSLLSTLDVTGATSMQSTLGVTGATSLLSTLDVTGATNLQSTLGVTGAATFDGGATTNDLTVSGNSAGHVALIENSEATVGDGLKIKLGRTHPAWDGTAYLNGTDPFSEIGDTQLGIVKGWIGLADEDNNGELDPPKAPKITDFIEMIPSAYIAGTLCNLGNRILEPLNNALGLPVGVGFDISLVDPECDLAGSCTGDDCDDCQIEFSIPRINIPCDALPSLSTPNLAFGPVDNSLTKENEFISFTDKEDRMLGAVRAQSVTNWIDDSIDANYLLNILAQVVGFDLLGGIMGTIAEFSNLTKAYNQIGVEYMSGHGDYAEWLERIDPEERLSAGDIVAVKGGRISKNMDGAEQVMAVSKNPIVLGNMPPAEREALGNKVAFIGQVPVKVQGPIQVGDYIVARSAIPGYGIAVAPNDMTADDFALCVGRSWETNERGGPKMVNTVVGVQNGDFVKILKGVIDKNQTLEARMQTLEERVDRVTRPNTANAAFQAASTGR